MKSLYVFVSVLVCLIGTIAGQKGGAECSVNVHCGWPAANVDSLREQAASISGGSCTGGVCVCAGNEGCARCTVTELPGSGTERDTLTTPSTTIDLCDMAFGGGVCGSDEQCGHGLCVDGRCVCYKDWGCEYCTLDINQDVVGLGAQCGDYVSGQGACTDGSNDCGIYGICRNSKCECGAGFGCARCQYAKTALVAGTESCPCTGVDCSGHGQCHNGLCVCNDGYIGANCAFDPCSGKDCSGHGTCSRSTGKCVCTTGYEGDDCSTGGSTCEEDKHCGIFGTYDFGGTCNDNGECECKDGYTCADCSGLGDECASARGGGRCTTVYDCGTFPTGFGGECVFTDSDKYWITEGRCRCWPGLTCPQCDVRISDFDAGVKCPPAPGNSASTTVTSAVAVVVAAAAAVAVAAAP